MTGLRRCCGLRRGGWGRSCRLGWRWRLGLRWGLRRGRLSGRGEAVVVVVVDGCDDCFAPVFFAAGGVEVVGGEIIAGEEVGEIGGEAFHGADLGFFLGVVETEIGTGGDAGSAAAAAVVEGETA